MGTKTVLDEITSDGLNPEDIKKRVTDWKNRVNSLYDLIEKWAPKGWKACRENSVFMHEEMMQKYGVQGKKIPTLKLHSEEGKLAEFEPRGLWIIGANGRIDLKYDKRRYMIVDLADNFKSSEWRVINSEDLIILRGETLKKVTKEWLQEILQ